MNMVYPKKYSAHLPQRKLKEIFLVANMIASSPETKAKVKLPKISIQSNSKYD